MKWHFADYLLVVIPFPAAGTPQLKQQQQVAITPEKWERLAEIKGLRLLFIDFFPSPDEGLELSDRFSTARSLQDLIQDVQSFISSLVQIFSSVTNTRPGQSSYQGKTSKQMLSYSPSLLFPNILHLQALSLRLKLTSHSRIFALNSDIDIQGVKTALKIGYQ